MEAVLLADAIAEYRQSLESVAEGLAASPGNAELLELKEQLEAALQDAEAALAGLQPEAAEQQQQQQDGSPPQPAAAAPAAPAAQPPAAATQPRRAPPGRSNARIHPRSKYAYEEPDFAALAKLYPSLAPFLLRSGGGGGNGSSEARTAAVAEAGSAAESNPAAGPAAAATPARASIDFTSPAACRELTRVLLRHDFGVEWWVPLGQLVPPVTNRANYIHWLQDLLGLSAPKGGAIVGLDIGCGANLIYPLLGACLAGWHMIGADCTPAALEWAARNLGANPQLAALIELRAVGMQPEQAAYLQAAEAGAAGTAGTAGAPGAGAAAAAGKGAEAAAVDGAGAAGSADRGECGQAADVADAAANAHTAAAAEAAAAAAAEEAAAEALAAAPAVATAPPARVLRLSSGEAAGSSIISAALRKGEHIAFCMCNPPFFESLEEAGRNPATAYGGTAPEMVYPGGELAFVSGMVQDSLALRGAVHWYTTMVGKKSTLRAARSLLYRHGVRVLRTTEFFQGKTSRWALAWSFVADAAAATKPLPRFPAAGAAAGAAAAGGSSAGAARAAAAVAALRPQRKLSWQHAGLFLLTAATKAPDGALGWFARLMQQLQAGLASRWTVQA
ncbi:methyltransferase 16 isoform X2 isoform A [Chlorella sorokiniana]|uniref:Methyltransferase 16 isoform X2 isoform A n=1 Tax=Chlorella sorokiniana TaxID=3076 RepID=A0A2P6TKC9_CHLSO|nr:methyltransferase 16 isoform X2 isoform A [Chlorella sorokiniana]|eukprot:PRW44527.1 methyltransferase 16 isoform X2 isoform A [Chlorella sorokiniana]